jgi:putative ABC transport system ATP-binding protein
MEATRESGDLVEMRDVSKVFLTDEVETHALAGVHIKVRRGEWLSIVGPSGCGKTTLLGLLGLLDRPTGGSYLLDGHAVTDLSATELSRIRNEQIGFIFQTFNLIGDLTVWENVELPLTYRSLTSAERGARVEAALAKMGMAHRARHMPGQLSGGQQQRVAVARAVVGEPRLLLADEPTGNLDSRNGEMVMDLLHQLHEAGATICMVTHDTTFARNASRIVHLLDGRIVDDAESIPRYPRGKGPTPATGEVGAT